MSCLLLSSTCLPAGYEQVQGQNQSYTAHLLLLPVGDLYGEVQVHMTDYDKRSLRSRDQSASNVAWTLNTSIW